jgi:hypothetical protein
MKLRITADACVSQQFTHLGCERTYATVSNIDHVDNCVKSCRVAYGWPFGAEGSKPRFASVEVGEQPRSPNNNLKMSSLLHLYLRSYPLYRFLIDAQRCVYIQKYNWFLVLTWISMYCTNCAGILGPTDLFCGCCGTRAKSPNVSSDDVQYISAAPSVSISTRSTAPSSAPSDWVSTSCISSTSSLTNEVRAQKVATTKQDRANSKDILPTSSFGLDPRGKA